MSTEYHNCFVCGKENPIGLKIDFSYDEAGSAFAKLSLPALFEGYPGMIHGGILSTLLDEAMGKAVIHSGKTAYTAQLTVNYRKALSPENQVSVKAWILHSKSRTIQTAAKIYDAKTIYADAEAVFVVPRKAP